ncbi:MAG: hypothetical protein OSB09_09440 [Planctomycetota bacterium]|nr:hypothetical protein [Planctomycetota bacterium]
MEGLSCDRCNKSLLIDEDVRYQVHIVVQAAYDPMEITKEDLKKSNPGSWSALMRQLEKLTEQEAQDQVHREFRFDLCPPCQKLYLANPLPERSE